MEESIVLIADPRVLEIPLVESQEDLTDLRNQSTILVGPSPEIENNTCYTFVRKSVFERLLIAQKILPSHLRLCLYEGLRSLSLQKQLFLSRWAKVKNLHPSWDDAEVYHETIKMVSPVITLDGNENIPPHATGAAVDIYLVDAQSSHPVEMGILAKDWSLDLEGILSRTDSELISSEAKENRKILNSAMIAAGFVNYPTEYWHWSYGDKYWAFVKGEPKAFYGPVSHFDAVFYNQTELNQV